MKRKIHLYFIPLIAATLGLSTVPVRAQMADSVFTIQGGSSCYMKFPAIREDTLSWDRPVLKDSSEGDLIDFCGPCDYNPVGKEAIEAQRADLRDDLYD